jgi:hypothetical protein
MNRRLDPREDKLRNAAAAAPLMPADPKPKPEQVIKKYYIQQPKRGEFYGVPKLALGIIFANLVAWSFGIALLYLALGNPPAKILLVVLGELILLTFWFVVVFAVWKLFWWVTGCAFSCLTALLFYAVIGIATGAITTGFQFPNF